MEKGDHVWSMVTFIDNINVKASENSIGILILMKTTWKTCWNFDKLSGWRGHQTKLSSSRPSVVFKHTKWSLEQLQPHISIQNKTDGTRSKTFLFPKLQ